MIVVDAGPGRSHKLLATLGLFGRIRTAMASPEPRAFAGSDGPTPGYPDEDGGTGWAGSRLISSFNSLPGLK